MKSAFCSLFALLLLTSCYERTADCKKFRTGTFEYSTYANGKLLKAKIVRNDSFEIDYSNKEHPDTAAIRWVNDCEYIARKYHAQKTTDKQAYKIRIVGSKDDQYTFRFSKVGDNSHYKEITAKRIEE